MVDSNYDWGQDVEELESRWAALTRANHGVPPHLVYFGLVDPHAIYRMPVSQPSLLGFMDRVRKGREGPRALRRWKQDLADVHGVVVCSVSAMELNPYGIDFSRVRNARRVGTVGRCFRVLYLPEHTDESPT